MSFENIVEEFNKLFINCQSINESLEQYINNIKDLYLKPDSLINKLKTGYNNNHPLSKYSLALINSYDSIFKQWSNSQKNNFDSISNYCNKLIKINSDIILVNSINNQNDNSININNSKQQYLNQLKEDIKININQQINEKVEKFDKINIEIQSSLSNLFNKLSEVHKSSSKLLEDNNTPQPPVITKQKESLISRTLNNITESFSYLNPPSLNQLYNDHSIHQKLWDKKEWRLNRVYNYSVSTVYTKLVKFNNGCTIKNLKFWMPIPPNSQTQSIKYSSFTLHDMATDEIILDSTIDKSAYQKMYLLNYESPHPLPYSTAFKVKYRVDADLYKIEMVPKEQQVVVVEPITDDEIQVYLRPTSKINFHKPEFKSFIEKYQLYQKDLPDGSIESVLSFAYRVALFVKIHVKYQFPIKGNLEALNTFEMGSGDCGCFSILFVAILRYNNIPARVLFGRLAINDTHPISEGQYHCKSEFYESSIGWVPFDGAANSPLDIYHTKHFSNDTSGNFISYHLDFISGVPELNTADYIDGFYQIVGWRYLAVKGITPIIESDIHSYEVKRINK